MTAQNKQEDTGVYHLLVGTEVSAKYRGAFCEAQIKSVKKNVIYKVANKKNGKCSLVSEDTIRGILKIGSLVEVQFPDQGGWQECTIQSTRDRSSYTVVFDDGDERTLTRGSLCLKGDRHYAKSETLDNLPLTDPENFGTPVLSNKKSRQRHRPQEDEYDDEEDQKSPDHGKDPANRGQKVSNDDDEEEGSSEEEEEDDNEKRAKWLADPLMGKVVIVEPNDKRKHWFPGLVVNPLCYERYKELSSSQLIVRSFKTGKFLRVSRSTLRELSDSTVPSKLDSQWQDIVDSAQAWRDTRTVPSQWRTDIKDILVDSEEEDSSDGESEPKKRKIEKRGANDQDDDSEEKQEEKKNHDFLEALYKFMEHRGTPINKTPVLGYKDLDLFLLYKLVQKRKGSPAISSIKEWKQIYLDLGIPKPNPAAGYNVRTAYQKYLASFEEYCISWKHIALPKRPCRSRSLTPVLVEEKKKSKRKESAASAKSAKKNESDKGLAEKRKLKAKDKEANKSTDTEPAEMRTRGRSSPIIPTLEEIVSVRRSGQRKRVSESSTASDALSTSGGKKNTEKQSKAKATATKPKTEEKARNPGGPDSEPDECSRAGKSTEKNTVEKKQTGKSKVEQPPLRRIRRNSTSSLSTQYMQNDKLKVKYGYGKTFKLYDAKVLQVKQPEAPGDLTEYFVHYAGWNSRHDEWIKPARIVGLIEERSPVPPSPNSLKAQTRRPKTPNGSRAGLFASLSTNDVPPSSRLSVDLTSKFEYPAKADSQNSAKEFSSMDLPSLEPLKKNLVEEFEKAKETRPISPVLVSSQRKRRSKSPYLGGPSKIFRPPSPLPILNPVKEEPTSSGSKSPSPESPKPASAMECKESNSPEPMVHTPKEEYRSASPSPSKPQMPKIGVEAKPCSIASPSEKNSSKTDDNDTAEASDMKKEETAPEKDSSSSPEVPPTATDADDVSGADAGGQRSSPPLQQPRRMSSRRSKSPAYLSDSSWYGITKRRKGNTPEKSPSPTPTTPSNEAENTVETQSPAAEVDTSTNPAKRSPSPSLSVSSTTSSSSADRAEEKEKSPVLTSNQSKPKASDSSKGTKTRTRARQKSLESVKEQTATASEPSKETTTTSAQTAKKLARQPTSEYDDFDEDVPDIALEKHKKGKLLPRSSDKRPVPLGLKYKNATSQGSTSEPKPKTRKSDNVESAPAGKAKKAAEEGDGSTKRKIRKKKPVPAVSETKQEEDNASTSAATVKKEHSETKPASPEPPQPEAAASVAEEDEQPPQEAPPPAEEPVADLDAQNTEPQDSANMPTSSRGRVSPQPAPSNFQQTSRPVDPPSSSKVLLENTPPTTPERSPTYASEDQDIDKHSPLMDDLLDIGDEPKDSIDSASSSSGFENPTSSSHELEKMDETAAAEEDDSRACDDMKTQEGRGAESTPSSPKKRRGRGRRSKRRRTTSKSQGNRRGSYGQDPESESDNEGDEENGRADGRKRNESGTRCKPKKKKAKARPEPPSAPPPLPREELESMSQDERIALLQSRMAEMRKVYHQLKQEVANIDRKRKRAKRREREAAAEAENLARLAKRGSSPVARTKGSAFNGRADSANAYGSALSSDASSKQAVSNGDSMCDDR